MCLKGTTFLIGALLSCSAEKISAMKSRIWKLDLPILVGHMEKNDFLARAQTTLFICMPPSARHISPKSTIRRIKVLAQEMLLKSALLHYREILRQLLLGLGEGYDLNQDCVARSKLPCSSECYFYAIKVPT